MMFWVRVPVLSEQIYEAPPIVSEASSLQTKFCSSFIFMTEYASEMVTASGNPSGTATTTTVIPIIKNEIKEFRVDIVNNGSPLMSLKTTRLIIEAMTVMIATQSPTFPI